MKHNKGLIIGIIITAIVVVLLFASWLVVIQFQFTGICESSTKGQCVTDEDCFQTGCNGDICASSIDEPEGVITACSGRNCISREKVLNQTCRCINNKCQWK